MLSVSQQQDPSVALEKLKNVEKMPDQKLEDVKKVDESPLVKTVPEKSATLYVAEQDGANLKVVVDLVSKKDVLKKNAMTGAEGLKESEPVLIKTLKEYMLPQYYKWKELKVADTKQYNLRTVSHPCFREARYRNPGATFWNTRKQQQKYRCVNI